MDGIKLVVHGRIATLQLIEYIQYISGHCAYHPASGRVRQVIMFYTMRPLTRPRFSVYVARKYDLYEELCKRASV